MSIQYYGYHGSFYHDNRYYHDISIILRQDDTSSIGGTARGSINITSISICVLKKLLTQKLVAQRLPYQWGCKLEVSVISVQQVR